MTAADSLHPVQFHKDAADRTSEHEAKLMALDTKGQDEASEFGYDEYGYGDSQWNRAKHSDKREVF